MSDGIQAAEARMTELLARLEAAVNAAEAANQKANSEAGFAFNAKGMAEEHAKAISKIKGEADAEIAGLATIKKNAEEAANVAASCRVTSDSNAQAIAEKKAQAEKDATAARVASEQGAAALVIVEDAKSKVTALFSEATTATNSMKESKNAADAVVAAMQKADTQVNELLAKSQTSDAAITKLEKSANDTFASFSAVVETANEAHKKVVEYEQKLAILTKDYADMHKKIEGLLPNATSAGLASAFRNQKDRFKNPQTTWLAAFVVTILMLLIVGALGVSEYKDTDKWDDIFRHLTSRLPIIVPLVWMGIYAGRNYMLALRVEEEYAFKEALSTAFEGYKREMNEIKPDGNNQVQPITTLCNNVLQALSQRPGRIYEGRHEDITPISPIKGMFGSRPAKDGEAAKKNQGVEE